MLMGRLNAFIRQHGGTPKTLFLRGYHAAFLGDREAAIGDLRQKPDHSQALSLLSFLGIAPQAPEMELEPVIELLPAGKQE